MSWLDKNMRSGRQGDSERLEDGTDTEENVGQWRCGITGGECPADPEATRHCPSC